uniref:NADH dehydrogenase subunit 6 n=1 Tax=Cladotaenia vulturi TaxID=1917734 RepID=A0A1J0I2Z0_9CEST|nr:NADH dehydrogenase subunit 6 [Cladotaenia vulturi]APC62888.1 NADH dehydrogenase subunit 6 [Cladotaenia vulturi]
MNLMLIFFVIYFSSLISFCLINNPICHCGLLVVNALIASLICYNIFSFSWYSLLFCLVYISGVYILFIFVSVFNPNSDLISCYNINISSFLIAFAIVSIGIISSYNLIIPESSNFLCTINEGNLYVCMCTTLIFGFIILSLIMSFKMNYYR